MSASDAPGNVTCADPSITWWNNDKGDTPCQMYENLVGRCEANFKMFGTDPNNQYFCSGAGTGLDTNVCCCNIATFSILQACIFCQTGVRPSPEPYRTFLTAGGACKDPSAINNVTVGTDVSDLNLPPWSFIPPVGGDSYQWNPTLAEANATRVKALQASQSLAAVASQSAVSVAAVASRKTAATVTKSQSRTGTATRSGAGQSSAVVGAAEGVAGAGKSGGVNGGAIGGAIGGVAIVALAAVGFFFWRRRQQKSKIALNSNEFSVDDDDETPTGRSAPQMAAVSPYVPSTPRDPEPETYYSNPSVVTATPAPQSNDTRSPLLSPTALATGSLPYSDSTYTQTDVAAPAVPPSSASSTSGPARGSGKGPLPGSGTPVLGYGSPSSGVGGSVAAHGPEDGYGQEVDAGRLERSDTVSGGQRAPPVYNPGWRE